MTARRVTSRAFTLVELLVVVAIIALLIGVLLPALGRARDTARTARCLTNQRSLITAWSLYAHDHDGRAMPLGYTDSADLIDGKPVYWWGSVDRVTRTIERTTGFITPYLDDTLREHSVYECPTQRLGTYRTQGAPDAITSTYGYNGYYLSPSKTPGWSYSIAHRPWKRLADIERPTELFAFADTLLPGSLPSNTALLDPPMLSDGGDKWRVNQSPTTAFRHHASAVTARADGSVRAVRADPAHLVDHDHAIGSAGAHNDPHYVPDWERWR